MEESCNLKNIRGKVIIITGASSGIGEAAARLLGDMGAIVILCGRNQKRLKKITAEIKEKEQKASYHVLDVTAYEDFQKTVQTVLDVHGRIDVLINNAGVMLLSPVCDGNVKEWHEMIDVNLNGVLHGTAAVLPALRKQKDGMILNVISTAAYRVMENSAVYSATKHAVKAFSEGLRKEESDNGIRVCLIAPGPTKTGLLQHISSRNIQHSLQQHVDEYGLEAADIAEAIAYQISVGKHACVNELIVSPTHKM